MIGQTREAAGQGAAQAERTMKKALRREGHGPFKELKECTVSFLRLRQFPSLWSFRDVGQETSFP